MNSPFIQVLTAGWFALPTLLGSADLLTAQNQEEGSVAAVFRDADADGRLDHLNQMVSLTGVVVEELVDGAGYRQTHLQDATRGIEVMVFSQADPQLDSVFRAAGLTIPDRDAVDGLEEGYVVRVDGRLVVGEGRPQLILQSLERLGKITPPPPRPVTVAELHSGEHRDVLVRVEGRVTLTPEGEAQARFEDSTGSIPMVISPSLLTDPTVGPALATGPRVNTTAFVEPIYLDDGTVSYRLSLDGRHDLAVQESAPFGTIVLVSLLVLLLLALIYVAGRRGAAEKKSEEMSRLVTRLESAQATLKASEGALRQSERQLRSLIEHAPYGIFRSGPEGKLCLVNGALVEMLGYSKDSDLLGRSLASEIFEEPEEWKELRSSLRDGKATPVTTARWTRSDGSSLPVRVRIHPVAADDGHGEWLLEGFVESVEEREQLEEQLRQSQKMEAIGQLAGGVAHDFNNLLTVILGSCSFLLEELADEQIRAYAEEIEIAGGRAAGLTQQLLAFSRRQTLAPKVVDGNEAVHSAHKLLRRIVEEDIDLILDLEPSPPDIRVDPGQIQQVIMNLVVNARDAVRVNGGGTIRIATRRVELDDAFVRRHPNAKPGPHMLLTVSDDGEGMTDPTLERVFEPFFSTKSPDKGTGLGLATVYGIVAQSGGYISVESEVGRGSTFYVYIPVVERCDSDRHDSEELSPPAEHRDQQPDAEVESVVGSRS